MKTQQLSNNSKWLWVFIVACFSWLLLSGCGATRQDETDHPAMTIEILYADTQGMYTRSEPSAEWIDSVDALGRLYAGFKTLRLSTATTPVPEIDFNRFRVLLVEMGQKPTAGYSIQFNRDLTNLTKETAFISLNWVEPAADMAVAQVITSPFMLLKMEKGKYTSVKIIDQHNQTLFNLLIPE